MTKTLQEEVWDLVKGLIDYRVRYDEETHNKTILDISNEIEELAEMINNR